MHGLRSLLLCVAFIAGGSLPLSAAEGPAPDATKVIVRSKSSLSQALKAALTPLLVDDAARPVLLVLDVTPNVRKNADKLRTALRALVEGHGAVASWRVAPLGGRAVKPTTDVPDAATSLTSGVSKDTPAVSTIGALAETIKRSKVRGTAIVYLNDWRFEDDADLEGLIKNLKRAGNALSIVGTEAAFGRGWNDGWVNADERFDLNDPTGFKVRDYHEGVGRCPFGKGDHEAPWHGGDSAYPHAPYRWHIFFWQYEFTEFDFVFAAGDDGGDIAPLVGKDGEPPDFEELAKRLKKELGKLGDDEPPSKDANRYFPIPAAYGPYGLMRAAGETGGRYVLWSWNPGGRRKVHYEYSRCNLFPPDLRSRKQIVKSLRKNPLAGSMLKAWSALEVTAGNTIEHNAPLKSNLRTARSIDRFDLGSGNPMPLSWHNKGEWRSFQRAAGGAIASLEKAGKILDKALQDGPDAPHEATARRYRADAELFRHVIRVVRLELSDGLAASQDLPKNAWSNGDKIPGVAGRTWIHHGHDPEKMRVEDTEPVTAELGQAVLADRKRLLTRYRGTPVAEIIGLNDVEPLQFVWWEVGGTMPDIGRSPTESDGKPKPNLPGGPSTGGGPTTGK